MDSEYNEFMQSEDVATLGGPLEEQHQNRPDAQRDKRSLEAVAVNTEERSHAHDDASPPLKRVRMITAAEARVADTAEWEAALAQRRAGIAPLDTAVVEVELGSTTIRADHRWATVRRQHELREANTVLFCAWGAWKLLLSGSAATIRKGLLNGRSPQTGRDWPGGASHKHAYRVTAVSLPPQSAAEGRGDDGARQPLF